MPKLPVIRARDVASVAESIGFAFDRQRGSHAVYYRASDRSRIVIPMHGTKDLKPGTLRAIINDMGVAAHQRRRSPVRHALPLHRRRHADFRPSLRRH